MSEVGIAVLVGALAVLFAWAAMATGVAVRRGVESRRHWDIYLKTHSFLITFLTQEMVDNRLRELAVDFSTAANTQARELTNRADQAAINRAEEKVNKTKKAFWQARDDAKLYGFTVQESIKDYLAPRPRAVS